MEEGGFNHSDRESYRLCLFIAFACSSPANPAFCLHFSMPDFGRLILTFTYHTH